jgi:hypothetical protein
MKKPSFPPAPTISANGFQKRHARKPAKNEHCLQRSLVNWCHGQGNGIVQRRFFAVPNGGARNIIQAARLKAEGVRPGAPDLVFYGPAGSVLWLELKNGTAGKLSEAQATMHEDLYHCGHRVVVARTLANAIEAVVSFYRSKV